MTADPIGAVLPAPDTPATVASREQTVHRLYRTMHTDTFETVRKLLARLTDVTDPAVIAAELRGWLDDLGFAGLDVAEARAAVADVALCDRYFGHRKSYVLRGECGYIGGGGVICRRSLGHNRAKSDGSWGSDHVYGPRASWDTD